MTEKLLYLQDEFRRSLKDVWPRKVLHVGARIGEEAPLYEQLGCEEVTWVEANPELLPKLRENVQLLGHRIIQALVSDRVEERRFHIANNEGHSSSILNLKEHLRLHPEVKYIKEMEFETVTIDLLCKRYNFTPNILNLDIQGAEGLAIKGAKETLKGIDVIYSEVNLRECYEGCYLLEDFKKLIPEFTISALYWATAGWGDAIFTRNKCRTGEVRT